MVTNSNGILAEQLLLDGTLAFLLKKWPLASYFATDFSNVKLKYNQTAVARFVTPKSAQTFDPAVGYSANNSAVTEVDILINKHIYTGSSFGVTELSSTNRNLIGEQSEADADAIGQQFYTDLCALMTPTNFPTHVVDATPGRSTFTTAGRALTTNLAPATGRNAFLGPVAYDSLLNDSALNTLLAYTSVNQIQTGQLSPINSINPLNTPGLPTTNNLLGFFSTKAALGIATRLPIDVGDIFPGTTAGTTLTSTDENSGLSLQRILIADRKKAIAEAFTVLMYGAVVIDPRCGCRVVSA